MFIEVSYVNRIVFKFLGTISRFLPHISNYIIDRRGQSEMRKYAKNWGMLSEVKTKHSNSHTLRSSILLIAFIPFDGFTLIFLNVRLRKNEKSKGSFRISSNISNEIIFLKNVRFSNLFVIVKIWKWKHLEIENRASIDVNYLDILAGMYLNAVVYFLLHYIAHFVEFIVSWECGWDHHKRHQLHLASQHSCFTWDKWSSFSSSLISSVASSFLFIEDDPAQYFLI